MRKTLHLLMAVCLFHVTTVSFLSELSAAFPEAALAPHTQPKSLPEKPHAVIIPELDPIVNSLSGAFEDVSKENPTSFTQRLREAYLNAGSAASASIDGLANAVYYLVEHPKIGIPVFSVVIVALLYCWIEGFSMLMGNPPGVIWHSFHGVFHPASMTYPELDHTPAYHVMDSKDQARYVAGRSSGTLSITDAVPSWFNDAQKILAGLAGLIIHQQQGDPLGSSERRAVAADIDKVFFAHGAVLPEDMRCSFKVGPEGHDRLYDCHLQSRPENFADTVVPEGADATVWFLRKWLSGRFDAFTFKVAPIDPKDLRYPSAGDTTPNPNHPEHGTTQRRLMQAQGNQTLPEAMEAELSQQKTFMRDLHNVSIALRNWAKAEDVNVQPLTDLVQQLAGAHHWVLSSEGVVCHLIGLPGACALQSCQLGADNVQQGQDAVKFMAQNGALSLVWPHIHKAPVQEAVAAWLMDSRVAKDALMNVVRPLAGDSCENNGQDVVLQSEVGRLFDHKGARMPGGDIGLPARFRDGRVSELAGHLGTPPTIDGSCDLESPVRVPEGWDGIVWLKRNAWNASAFGVPMVTVSRGVDFNRPLETPAPATPVPTTPVPETPVPTTEAPVAVANYIYWARFGDDNAIYRAELFPNGTATNPVRWMISPHLYKIRMFSPDFASGYLYGASSDANVWEISNTSSPSILGKERIDLSSGSTRNALVFRSDVSGNVYVYNAQYNLLQLQMNASNPSQVVSEINLGQLHQRLAGGFYVDEPNGRIYVSGGDKIEVGRFPQLDGWQQLDVTGMTGPASIYGIYLYGPHIYWNHNEGIYRGTVDRQNPATIEASQLVLAGTPSFRIGNGGMYVAHRPLEPVPAPQGGNTCVRVPCQNVYFFLKGTWGCTLEESCRFNGQRSGGPSSYTQECIINGTPQNLGLCFTSHGFINGSVSAHISLVGSGNFSCIGSGEVSLGNAAKFVICD